MAKKKILVVSRECDMRLLLGLALNKDYEVNNTSIIDEEGVMAEISRVKPDLIILEIVMPQIKELISVGLRIRQETDIPILMLGIAGAEENMVRILNLRLAEHPEFFGYTLDMSMLKQRIQELI